MTAAVSIRVDRATYLALLTIARSLEKKQKKRRVPIGEAVRELLREHDNHQKED